MTIKILYFLTTVVFLSACLPVAPVGAAAVYVYERVDTEIHIISRHMDIVPDGRAWVRRMEVK